MATCASMEKTLDKYCYSTSEKAALIKKALREALPDAKRISVKKGSGTASGWIETHVTMPAPENESERSVQYQAYRAQVYAAAQKALQDAGTYFYTYYADDGYDTERECHLVTISFE